MQLKVGITGKPKKWYEQFLLSLLFVLPFQILPAFGQQTNQIDEKADLKKPETAFKEQDEKREVDVNFLFNYYDQDGDHSAVTGGIGTEELKDRALKIIVNVPLDSVSTLNINSHLNVYSSASTDNINDYVSSASAEDLRIQMNIGYTRETPEKNSTYSVNFGGSIETDYISASVGGQWSKDSKDKNRSFGIRAHLYFDTWLPIFPDELRRTSEAIIETNKRRSYNLELFSSQVINKKLQVSISSELVYQKGLLSTPFHRVYFIERDLPKIEKLPAERWKLPLGFRVNYFINDYVITRLYYRFYSDNFGIQGHTASIETPLKLNNFFSIYPFYRFHTQTQADFFKGFKRHSLNQKFYSSDYDLSAFNSNKVGIGIHYAPLWGIGRFKFPNKRRVTRFKSIDLRLARYSRSDGLNAFLISTDFAFAIK
ncbi:DUF3570 domain-containing protein [Fulvivirgaceae bacterium BMA10]|uniref:DUF3570 domain-containing protein n=1 Tax=Splendidivirga corallicola TaxID=3051826 RepID=A0ABT8KPI1_9BACT|nr:DUF3570 domain-containing protein [Fulvivirgaceae bacterium BMA10]